VEKKDDALLVPRPALVKEKANNFVFIAVDSRAKKVPVTIGFSDSPNVEIVSGVKPEDEVLTAPQSLREGEPIVPDKTSSRNSEPQRSLTRRLTRS
jgi:multidrug efflux pump subunit AcrA (membrane-fusion protein)